MATYYVIPQVGGASDSNAGSKASPWVTIDKAANTVAAGDTVHVAGNWTYKELVTMDTSGTSGNQISFIADVTGENTGYGGIVLISSVDDPNDNVVTRSYCWNQNGKEFITIRGFTMFATSICIYDNGLVGNRAYEGVIIEDCALQGMGLYSIDLDLNEGVTPTGNGLIIRRCVVTVVVIRHDGNATAHTNVKVLIENVDAHKYLSSSSVTSSIIFSQTSSSTYSVGGVTVANCVMRSSAYGINFAGFKNTTNVSRVISCLIYAVNASVYGSGGVTAAIEVYSCAGNNTALGATNADPFVTTRLCDISGGFADFPLYRFLGWSPYLPSEPISMDGFTSGSLAYGNSEKHLPTEDMYGNPRGMGRPTHWSKFYFDASDDAVSDPGNVWTSEANAFDLSFSNSASTNIAGSSSSNYVSAGGTNVPASGGTIIAVYARAAAHTSSSRTTHYEIYTNGLTETLASIAITPGTTARYTDWSLVSAPSAGWDWASLAALEAKFWMDSGGSGTLYFYGIQLAVSTSAGHSDIGAVEARAQPVLDSTVYRLNTYSAKLPGAGYHNDLAEVVSGVAVKISRWVKWDTNYVGTKPQMVISNIPGVDDITVTASGSTDTWYELTATFTPTASGAVLVKIKSNDASTNGNCWFADDSVTFP